jgi:hypothetical protein
MLERVANATQRVNDEHKSVIMEIVEDVQQKLKDVAMEEVEDMHAQDSNKYDDEMKIYILPTS